MKRLKNDILQQHVKMHSKNRRNNRFFALLNGLLDFAFQLKCHDSINFMGFFSLNSNKEQPTLLLRTTPFKCFLYDPS